MSSEGSNEGSLEKTLIVESAARSLVSVSSCIN